MRMDGRLVRVSRADGVENQGGRKGGVKRGLRMCVHPSWCVCVCVW